MPPPRHDPAPASRADQPTPERVRAAHEAILAAVREPGQAQPLDDLLCFYQFDRWTVSRFAARWHDPATLSLREALSAEAMARRDLQRLQRLGAVDCLAGSSLPRAARQGVTGRPGDLFYLNALGARILARELGLGSNAIKPPRIALDRGRPAAGGLVKHRRASRTAWDPHLFACQDLALRHRWLERGDWRFMRRLPLTFWLDNREAWLIPDACLLDGDTLFAVEVEGTEQREHIKEKHAKYAALAHALARDRGLRLQLTVVFVSAGFRRQALRQHEVAFARRAGGYGFAWLDLEAALTAEPGGGFWAARQFVDRAAIRERQWKYHQHEWETFRP